MKEPVKKAAKLNEFDRQVLTVYSDFSMETGLKKTAEADETKAIHKNNVIIKV